VKITSSGSMTKQQILCKECVYYVADPRHTFGDCRRHCPVPSPDDSAAWWPVVNEDHWCGDAVKREHREG